MYCSAFRKNRTLNRKKKEMQSTVAFLFGDLDYWFKSLSLIVLNKELYDV